MKLRSPSHYVALPWHDQLRVLCRLFRLIAVVGEPGLGKSYFARRLAHELTGKKPVILSGGPLVDLHKVFGRWLLSGGETRFVDGDLPIALKENRILIAEEYSLWPPEVRAECLALRSDEDEVENPLNGERIQIPDGWHLIALSNPESLACQRNPETMRALMSDFAILRIPPLREQDIRQFLQFECPDAAPEELERVLGHYERYRQIEPEGPSSGEDKYHLTFRAAKQLLRLLRLEDVPEKLASAMPETAAVEVSLVNAYSLDPDLYSAAHLKFSLSGD